MKTYLDGNPIAYPNDSLNEPKFSIRRQDEQGDLAFSFTSDLTFTGTDAEYVRAKLIDDPQAINNYIELKFIDDCCGGKEYKFVIKPESLKWCENTCEITANATEFTDDSKLYTCLENTLIWDNYNGFKQAYHPRIKYCLEYRPSLLQDAILIIGMFTIFGTTTILAMLGTILLPLIGLVNLIVEALNAFPGVNLSKLTVGGFDDPIDIFNFIKDTFEKTNGQLIAGCGYEHPSPLVRAYIGNVCNKCGISFQSSVLNEPNPLKPNHDYYNLVYFSAPIKSGRVENYYFKKPLVPFIEDNEPIHNGKTFFNEIEQPFNAKWDIKDGVLRFERRDFFQQQVPFFDVNNYDSDMIIRQCYEWSKNRRPSYADLSYQKDAVDWCGSEAQRRWSDIVEWNPNHNPIQKGALTKMFPYSPARFREDGLDRDVLSDYKWMPYGIGQAIKDNANVLIMNNGTSFTPKLLIWDGNNPSAAIVRRGYLGQNTFVNYPMWVDANLPGNLYDRFWKIENPNNANFSGHDFEVEVTATCELINAININGTIMTSKGLSKTLTLIEIDYSTNKIIIKGTV